MRIVGASAVTALNSGAAALVMLIEMNFTSGTLRLNTSRYNITDLASPSVVFLASRLMGSIEEVWDTVREAKGLKFTLSGLDPGVLAIALAEQVRGRSLKLFLAVLDSTTHNTLDIVQVWSGQMASAPISYNSEDNTATIVITAEHRGVLFSRAKPIRYTDADQVRLYPGDHCLEYVVSQSQVTDIWPAASFWAQ